MKIRRRGSAITFIALVLLASVAFTQQAHAAAATIAPGTSLTDAQRRALIVRLAAQVQALFAQVAAITGGTSENFSGDLQLGSTSSAVNRLQVWLNAHGYAVAANGPGSSGNETAFFGILTYRALIKFQTASGLPATGFFGPLTRAVINSSELSPIAVSSPPVDSPISPPSNTAPNQSLIPQPLAPGNGYTPGFGGGGGGSPTPAPDTIVPSVSITAPADSAIVSGISVTLSATASDNVGVTGVQFKVDSVSAGAEDTSSPYSFTWDSTSVADGSHTAVAVARDAAGNYATSTAITVTVDNTAPSISLTAPADSATISGSSVALSASGSDAVGIIGVTFKVDNATVGSEDTSLPYAITFDSMTVQNGARSIVAVARDAAGNVATSSAVTVTNDNYDYYVDGVNGSDSNTGLTSSQAFRNISALPTISAGQSVGLANGSHWRQQLTINADNVTVTGYGSGALPILDASDQISNASLTKTPGYTNVYNSATTTFTMGGGIAWANMWETGGPGDSSTGTFLSATSSIAAVDATACSYYIPTMTTSLMPSAQPIYVHSCDSTSPVSNGYTYEVAQRAGLSMTSRNGIVRNIEGRKNAANDGSIILQGDGYSYAVNNVVARDGGKHNILLSGGSTLASSTIINSYYNASGIGGGMIEFHDGIGSGLPVTISTTACQTDQIVTGNGTANCAGSHASSGNLGAVTLNNIWVIAKNDAQLGGFSFGNAGQITATSVYGSQLSGGFSLNSGNNLILGNSQFVSFNSIGNQPISTNANNLQISISGSKFCSTNNTQGIIRIVGNSGTSVNLSSNSFYLLSPNANSKATVRNNGTGASFTFNNNDFGGNTQFYTPLQDTGSSNTFSGDNNIYESASFPAQWQLNNGSTITTLAAWKALVSPADANATTTGGSAVDACTLPTMPTVN